MMSRGIALLVAVLLSSSLGFSAPIKPEHPDPEQTPGDLCHRNDPDFNGYRYKQRVAYCLRNVSDETKDGVYDYYGINENLRRNYTVDHFIPLSIGGSNNVRNLWPEHKKIKDLRLHLEEEIYQAVRDGEMTQDEAILKITKAKMNPPLPKN